ncbi:MAG: class I SAM-dependent methyltransferase [Pirellulales bacterium]|nr:class I SAM-dependent methyltransferase [Pirellulales bacterium]
MARYPAVYAVLRVFFSPVKSLVARCRRVAVHCWPEKVSEFPYKKNEEIGAINIEIKQDRLERGEVFEWPNIVELNLLCQEFSANKQVLDVGCGTGCAAYAMSKNASHVVAIEPDEATLQWASHNRSASNLRYLQGRSDALDSEDMFDLITNIDVIEHVDDYLNLLLDFVRLLRPTGTLLLTTPNRNRDKPGKLCPSYPYHVQEFSASDLYFILNMFFDEIELYSLKDVYDRTSRIPVDINTRMTPIIVVAKQPKKTIDIRSSGPNRIKRSSSCNRQNAIDAEFPYSRNVS